MTKGRVEAFSDGVLAIIITIMVLELKVPHGHDLAALRPVIPVFLSYVLSFVYIGIYWNNHHHLFHAVTRIGGDVLWANLHLLFWLSLVPFTTGFMGENNFATTPVALYTLNMTLCAIAYVPLTLTLRRHQGQGSAFARAFGSDRKGKISIAIYVLALLALMVSTWVTLALVALVAVIWLIPDRRFGAIATPRPD